MNKSILIENAGDHGAIWQCQFIQLVGNRLFPVIEQLKFDESLFLQKFAENITDTAGPSIADKCIWRTCCDCGAASR